MSESEMAGAAPKRGRRWLKALGAGVLSLLAPGLGQLVNRQLRKALALGGAWFLLRLSFTYTHWMLSFPFMVGALAAGLLLQLGAAVEAGHGAITGKREAPVPAGKISYAVIVVVLVAIALFPSNDQVIHHSGFSAFRVASSSMCPAVCKGERVVANRKAYESAEPQRGEVILVKHEASEAPFLKRVIGLPGDVITQASDGTVLLNGVVFHPPAPCAKPEWKGPTPPTCPTCTAATVKPGEYFVIGDDLGNSLDSRYKEFGPVTKKMLVGKVLFIYWSGARSRIGCKVR